MTYPLKSNTSETYEDKLDEVKHKAPVNAPSTESRNVIYASLRPQRATVRSETAELPLEPRDVVRSGDGATIRVMTPEAVSKRLIPFPHNEQNSRTARVERPLQTRPSQAPVLSKTPYFPPSIKTENRGNERMDGYVAPAPLVSPQHVAVQKQRQQKYSQKEVVLVMNKLSLASMVFGLMVMGSLCFAVGFLAAVTIYSKNEHPAQTPTQFWMAQQNTQQAHPQASQQAQAQPQQHKHAQQQQAPQNAPYATGQQPTAYASQGYPAQQPEAYNPAAPNAATVVGSAAGYEAYRAAQNASVPAPLRPFAAYAAKSASYDPTQVNQEAFKHAAQAAAPNPFHQQPGYAGYGANQPQPMQMAGAYPAPIRAYGYPAAPQQAPYRP